MTEPTDAEIRGLAATGNGVYQDDETAIWEITDPSLMKFARAVLAKWGQPAQATKCECTLAQRCTGSGCRYCNPQEYIDMLHEQIADAETAQAAEPVAYLTRNAEGDPAMLFFDKDEASTYCEDGVDPAPLFTAPQPVAREPLPTIASVEMIDAAMVEMRNIVPPLRRGECQRLIDAALSAAHGIKGGQHER